jgi:hypothetical protein
MVPMMLTSIVFRVSCIVDAADQPANLDIAGIDEKHIDAPFVLPHVLEKTVDIRDFRGIGLDATGIRPQPGNGVLKTLLVPAGDDHLGAFLNEAPGAFQGQTIASSGNDGGFACQFRHAFSP